MNRRGFFKGVAAVLIATAVPASFVKTIAGPEATRGYCVDKLLKLWQAETKGHTGRRVNFEVGRQFYEAFEGELLPMQRFSYKDALPTERYLAFKAGRVKQVGEGWGVRVV